MLWLHIAVFLFGLAGVLGKFLHISSFAIVWGRTTFATIAILAYLLLRREWRPFTNRTDILSAFLQGSILALHWVTFFYSIQISSVAVGLLGYSTFPIFVLCLERVIYRTRLASNDLLSIVIVLAGVLFILPNFDLAGSSVRGVLWGTFSGFSFALLSLMNRRLSPRYPAAQLSLVQNFVAALLLTPFVFSEVYRVSAHDWVFLLGMGICCTALAHSLFINSLKRIRVFTASIVASLEPVYGIAAAFVLLGEVPAWREVCGGLIILGAAIWITVGERRGEVL